MQPRRVFSIVLFQNAGILSLSNNKGAVYLTDCVAGQSADYEDAVRKIAETYVPTHAQVMDSREYLQA